MSVRWGFLGAGFVASRGLAPAVHTSRGASLYAVASRDERRSATLEPERVHASYDDLLADDRVDAVYISLSNGQHREWVVKSLEAGKHVLCEKPLGIRADDTHAMFEAAATNGRLLVEAVWSRWHPRFARLVHLVANGDIGAVHHIESAFTFVSDMTDNYRLDPAMGGGALLDVGCYQAHSWVALTGGADEFTILHLERTLGSSGVDLTTEVTVRFAGDVTAHSLSSFALPSRQELVVRGTDGEISTARGESFTTWNEASSLRVNGVVEEFPETNAFVVMVENVSRVIRGEDAWVVPPSDSERVAALLDSIARHP